MFDKNTLLQKFIQNFVLNEFQERSMLELSNPKKRAKFTNRLNHNWESILNMKELHKIDSAHGNYSEIQKSLTIPDEEIVYVISNYDSVDDQFLPFKEAFKFVYSKGLASIIVNCKAQKIYLETEQEKGAGNRYFGLKK